MTKKQTKSTTPKEPKKQATKKTAQNTTASAAGQTAKQALPLPQTAGQLCKYELKSTGVHELRYDATSQDVIQEMLEHVDRVLGAASSDTVQRFLADGSGVTQSGPIMLGVAFKMQHLGRQYRETRLVRAACISQSWGASIDQKRGVFVGPAETLFNLLAREGQFRHFQPDQKEQALAWLLA